MPTRNMSNAWTAGPSWSPASGTRHPLVLTNHFPTRNVFPIPITHFYWMLSAVTNVNASGGSLPLRGGKAFNTEGTEETRKNIEAYVGCFPRIRITIIGCRAGQ